VAGLIKTKKGGVKVIQIDEKIKIGHTYRNSNGNEYFCIAKNNNYALFQQVGREFYLVAWLPTFNDQNKMYWQQGHYFGENLQAAIEYLNTEC
jgi:hypothetical protein